MSLKVVFELDDSDLQHFQLIMQQASRAAAASRPEEIVAEARKQLDDIDSDRAPHFIVERLESLRVLIAMMEDHEWGLPADDARGVLNALAYFCESEDLIPDSLPGLGYLDDAIMVELAVRELRPEIDAYRDFCEFREKEVTRRGVKAKSSDVTREDWLDERRRNLQDRMRHRRRERGSDKDEHFRLF